MATPATGAPTTATTSMFGGASAPTSATASMFGGASAPTSATASMFGGASGINGGSVGGAGGAPLVFGQGVVQAAAPMPPFGLKVPAPFGLKVPVALHSLLPPPPPPSFTFGVPAKPSAPVATPASGLFGVSTPGPSTNFAFPVSALAAAPAPGTGCPSMAPRSDCFNYFCKQGPSSLRQKIRLLLGKNYYR